MIEAQAQLSSARADHEAFIQQWSTTISQDLVTARNTRDGALAQLEKAQKHSDLVRIAAQQDSIILTVAKLSVGSVLKEGDELMTVMPVGVPVEAEVNVASRDIGFLRVGDPAMFKVDAFNSPNMAMPRAMSNGSAKAPSPPMRTPDSRPNPIIGCA